MRMEQLIAHLTGDYVLQNRWLAERKLQSLPVALLHGLIYSLPFLLITSSPSALSIIFLSHALIDRYNVGGRVRWLIDGLDYKANRVSWQQYQRQISGNGLSFAIRILTDNTIHLAINFFAIKYL